MLLDLVDGKGQQHQQCQHRCQVEVAVPVVVLEMITLILQRIEGLILDLPATATGSHHRLDRTRMEPQVGDPGPSLHLTLAVSLLVEQVVDFDIHGAIA